MSVQHPVVQLWAQHHPVRGYPTGVEAVPEPIPGLAFFPGGWGLWGAEKGVELPPMPVGGIMVLGHDFHSRSGYDESLRLGGERATLPTWRNLLSLLNDVEIPRESCFFTNLYMGLRSGTKTTGLFPGASDQQFQRHCQDFLLAQLDAQRPRLILTLGVHVPPVIAELSNELTPWAGRRGIKQIDAVGALRERVQFRELKDFTTTIAALLHPSLRHASLRHRRYTTLAGSELTGAAAESGLLRDALTASA